MGYDLPAAIGARVGVDECGQKLPIICVAGDGSIQMNIQELQSIVSRNLNIKIFLINNNGYLSIRSTHENFFEQVFGASPESGIDFPDFCRVANAYGIKSMRVSCPEEFASVLTRISNQGPELFELIVDPAQEFFPKLKSRKSANGEILTPELDDMYPFLPEAELLTIRDSAKKIIR
jgi:acetolactate synthase-1/2/3 large subunit